MVNTERGRCWLDREGRVLFVHQGIGTTAYGVYYRRPNGSLKRLVSPSLPLCELRDAAQAHLDLWARRHNLTPVGGLAEEASGDEG